MLNVIKLVYGRFQQMVNSDPSSCSGVSANMMFADISRENSIRSPIVQRVLPHINETGSDAKRLEKIDFDPDQTDFKSFLTNEWPESRPTRSS